jgi:hypothetical protein
MGAGRAEWGPSNRLASTTCTLTGGQNIRAPLDASSHRLALPGHRDLTRHADRLGRPIRYRSVQRVFCRQFMRVGAHP